jgi:hypothetical protein
MLIFLRPHPEARPTLSGRPDVANQSVKVGYIRLGCARLEGWSVVVSRLEPREGERDDG